MRLDLIAEVLAASNIVGLEQGIGGSIFTDAMDEDVTIGALLRNPLVGVPVDGDLPGYYRTTMQVVVRHTAHDAGEDLARAIQRRLTMFNRRFLDPDTNVLLMRVNYLYPAALPIRFPRSVGGGIEWSLNFKASYVLPFL